jgi:hypothetical protein
MTGHKKHKQAVRRARKKRDKLNREKNKGLTVLVPGGDLDKLKFNQQVLAEFSKSELLRINRAIYLNPEHIEYYIAYKCSRYTWCMQYLLDNRHLLKG